eukprot:TRINITY_DN49548_c0_g1_i1.p1 TRINITY_DN49548_c0_g1~~TRINITY_DN49548_c0_g1_i1.p1  ORF type:complete len:761 (-),score=142.30 TRINITY_DN49548_c0_g1_i1:323-2536(-)
MAGGNSVHALVAGSGVTADEGVDVYSNELGVSDAVAEAFSASGRAGSYGVNEAMRPGEMIAAKQHSTEKSANRRDQPDGLPRMTLQTLRECCVNNNGYEAPELNDVLILPYKGFRKIENLHVYSKVTSLFLESNGITRIENLDGMSNLKSLYLQHNCISRMENLDNLKSLQYLNLMHNSISNVENLGHVYSLETLNVSANKIIDIQGLNGLAERPSLKSVDVSQNYIEDGDGLINFWAGTLTHVECLYLHNNPCSRCLKNSRQRLISSLPKLRWIDTRPVTERDRAGGEAWARGGKEAELKAMQDHFWKEKAEKEKSFMNFKRMSAATIERAQAQRDRQGRILEQKMEREQAQEPLATDPADRKSSHKPLAVSSCKVAPCVDDAARPPDAKDIAAARAKALSAKVAAFRESRQRPPEPTSAKQRLPFVDNVDRGSEMDEHSSQPLVHNADFEALRHEACESNLKVFEWTAFRDRRLGSLVAESKYNFVKVAEAISVEFGCFADEKVCRSRYRELLRPTAEGDKDPEAVRRRIREDSGRAKDSVVDVTAMKECTDWWARKFAINRSASDLVVGTSELVDADTTTAVQYEQTAHATCSESLAKAPTKDSSVLEPYTAVPTPAKTPPSLLGAQPLEAKVASEIAGNGTTATTTAISAGSSVVASASSSDVQTARESTTEAFATTLHTSSPTTLVGEADAAIAKQAGPRMGASTVASAVCSIPWQQPETLSSSRADLFELD